MCAIWYISVSVIAPKLQWSIGKTNCLYYFTREDLYSHQILLRFISLFCYHTFLIVKHVGVSVALKTWAAPPVDQDYVE